MLLVSATVGWLVVLIPALAVVGAGSGGNEATSAEDQAVLAGMGKVWVLSLLISISGLSAGRRLLRGGRYLVLWLRRFRFEDATRVVSASLDHIGRSWRVITLDDEQVEAVGVAPGLGGAVSGFDAVRRVLTTWGPPVVTAVKWTAKVAIVVLVATGLWVVVDGTWPEVLNQLPGGSVGRPETVPAVLIWVSGAFLLAVLAVMVAFPFVVVAVLPLLGIVFLIGELMSRIRAVETAKKILVRSGDEMDSLLSGLTAGKERLFAPRLTVLHVHPSAWQPAVLNLVGRADVVVLDVSEVTDNLLWEVQQVAGASSTVFVGRLDRVLTLTGERREGRPESRPDLSAELRRHLAGQDILAYTPDLLGRLRFQRALLGRLEDLVPPRRLTRTTVRDQIIVAVGILVFGVATVALYALTHSWVESMLT